MSGTTSVPQPTFGPNGFIVPSGPAVLAGTQADISSAFGGNLNTNGSTPQGQIASSEAAVVQDKDDQFLALTQGVDPAYASGRMQDGIARIYFIERNPALPTTVQALCSGQVNTIIPPGAAARAQDGNIYSCTSGGTIPLGGSLLLSFTCNVFGPIACPATSLNEIYQTIVGWDSISNPSDGVLGTNVETRAQFELRRQQSLAKNAVGSNSAVLGAVLAVADVLDAYVTDNFTGSPIVLDSVTLPAHSLYVCVAGGDQQLVAQAIWTKKSPGCAYATGNVTQTVQDTSSGYVPPYPSYAVTFQDATPQTFLVAVRMTNSSQVPANALALIQAAVLEAFAGADGGSRARINSTVYASRYYGPVASLGAWAGIITIKLGSTAAPDAVVAGSIFGDTLTVTSHTSGTIVVGATLISASVPDGVIITALGSGTGGIGTYIINLPQSVATESMVTVTPALDDIVVGAAHVPVLGPANVALILV